MGLYLKVAQVVLFMESVPLQNIPDDANSLGVFSTLASKTLPHNTTYT